MYMYIVKHILWNNLIFVDKKSFKTIKYWISLNLSELAN